jgi:hypothetical protein
VHLARGEVSGPPRTSTTAEGGQQVGHAKVRHHGVQRLCAGDKDVGSPEVPVQDAQGVQVQQGGQHLLQQGQDTGQGQAALRSGEERGEKYNNNEGHR